MILQTKFTQIIVLIFDIIISSIITLFFILFLINIFFINKIIKPRQKKSDRKILFMLTLGSFEAIQKKGISHMILERDENGYFDHVYSIYLFSNNNTHIKINDRHTILEFGENYNLIKKYGLIYTSIILTYFNSFPKIYKMVNSEQNCIIRTLDPYINGLYGFFVGNLTGVPYCVSIHTDYYKIYENNKCSTPMLFGSVKLTKILERFVLSHTPMVLPIRDYLRQYAIRNGAIPESIRLIPHGVDILKFERKPNEQLKKDLGFNGKQLIVFAGRLSKENYVEDMIKSAKIIAKNYPNALFLLIGEGPEKSHLSKLIQKYQLEKNVFLMDFLPNEKIIEIRSIADVNLCLMGGFSLIEAGLSGNPVIAYNVEWHYELVKNCKTGYLLNEGDIETLTDSIIALLNNPELGKMFGEKMKTLVKERHSLAATTKIKIDCYDELFKTKWP